MKREEESGIRDRDKANFQTHHVIVLSEELERDGSSVLILTQLCGGLKNPSKSNKYPSSQVNTLQTILPSPRSKLHSFVYSPQPANALLSLAVMAPGGPGGARGRGGKFRKFTRGGRLPEYSRIALYPLTHLQVVNTSHGTCDHSMLMETNSPKETPTHQHPRRRRTPKRRLRPRRRRRTSRP